MATVKKVFVVKGNTVTEVEVNKLINKYLKLKQKEKQIEKEIAEIGGILKALALEDEDNKVIIREHTISVSPCEKKNVSYKVLAEKHPRIAKEVVTISRYMQLNVK